MRIGLDIGSTTVKCVVLNQAGELLFSAYERHRGKTAEAARGLLDAAREACAQAEALRFAVTGSAGLGLAERMHMPFVQEVFATRIALSQYLPEADVAIELGGEDAKILFVSGGAEVRMNGSCAGGTGAFLDQMATLLDITTGEINDLALDSTRVYPIASRCGVFAKSDIQPLVNQGARIPDICMSILHAVVDQTIAGLAQGRPIEGRVAYLGGPMTFSPALRSCFDEALDTRGICPANSLYYAALGAALGAPEDAYTFEDLEAAFERASAAQAYPGRKPLFSSREEYQAFCARHGRARLPEADPSRYEGEAYLGVDAGSTTIKMVVMDRYGRILAQRYELNHGDPISVVKDFLLRFCEEYPRIRLSASASTGYGEQLVKNAFGLDEGLVETMAHFLAARALLPEVTTIIDIGGQDIKCFFIKNGAIDSIFLNEACSSGCGSFLQTFASALGDTTEAFAALGLFADRPVDLGSRCTVFMNSSVKQAQKDGVSIENISAGLSVSVVKNVLYKVLRVSSSAALGAGIVVQGGTFLNDAVLRAFEQEIGREVIRPAQSGLMGAYGAALHARSLNLERTSLISGEALTRMTHHTRSVNCNLCTNHCPLTINDFGEGRRFIAGNRCERPLGGARMAAPNLYAQKRAMISPDPKDGPVPAERAAKRPLIGIPLGLNLYELMPFWTTFFEALDIEVLIPPASDRKMYRRGQKTIPSDTVCYPAKLMHGQIDWLLDHAPDAIFYPCMTYNLDEGLGDNHYNCPVVAYYPEVLDANMPRLAGVPFLDPYLGLHKPRVFPTKIHQALAAVFPNLTLPAVRRAAKAAYAAYGAHMARVRARGGEIIEAARATGQPIIVLAGRPYHIDPEISHGIDQMIAEYGAAVVSEDAISHLATQVKAKVLNQWTYHARLYSAAKYIVTQPDMQLVQLVSFGCGVDAITADEVRAILEAGGKLYTQLKIDEIANLGAARIRMRSLFAAMRNREEVNTHDGGRNESQENEIGQNNTHPQYGAAPL